MNDNKPGLSMLLVSGNIDVMIVATPYCKQCVKDKTGYTILREFPISIREYKELLKDGVSKGVKVSCVCSNK